MSGLPARPALLRRCVLMVASGLKHKQVHRHQQLGLLRRRQGRKHWGRDDYALSARLHE